MNVLSLFDGMSCGQIALERTGIRVDNYFASEIDKYAIAVTMANYPNTIQLGDVRNIKTSDLPKIDLLIGGSPCQGFSFAGKQLNFNDERSKLFFEFVRLKNELNPTYFLLENVKMKREYELTISRFMGNLAPIEINSALLSAQNRVRLYWTNINQKQYGLFNDFYTDIPQPKDKGILLKDILEKEVAEKYFISEKAISGMITHKQRNTDNSNGFGVQFIDKNSNKSNTILQRYYKDCKDNALCVASRGRNPENTSDRTPGTQTEQRLEPKTNGKTNTLISVQKDNLIFVGSLREHNRGKGNLSRDYSEQDRVYSPDGKGASVVATSNSKYLIDKPTFTKNYLQWGENNSQANRAFYPDNKNGSLGIGHVMMNPQVLLNSKIRRLTEIECERLQTVPDNYTNHVSSTQRYKMLGNGWTVDVVAHIFSYLK